MPKLNLKPHLREFFWAVSTVCITNEQIMAMFCRTRSTPIDVPVPAEKMGFSLPYSCLNAAIGSTLVARRAGR